MEEYSILKYKCKDFTLILQLSLFLQEINLYFARVFL